MGQDSVGRVVGFLAGSVLGVWLTMVFAVDHDAIATRVGAEDAAARTADGSSRRDSAEAIIDAPAESRVAAVPKPSRQEPTFVGDGWIRGRVVDESGVAVAGVHVRVEPVDLPTPDDAGAPMDESVDVALAAAERRVLRRTEGARTATTDTDGRYRVDGLAEERYHVSAFAPNMAFEPVVPRRRGFAPGTVVDLRGVVVAELGVDVRTKDGAPLDRAVIEIRPVAGDGGGRTHRDLPWDRSDPAIHLPAGRHEVSAAVPASVARELGLGAFTWRSEPRSVVVTGTDALDPIELRVRPRAELEGVVTTASGDPPMPGRVHVTPLGRDGVDDRAITGSAFRKVAPDERLFAFDDLDIGRFVVAFVAAEGDAILVREAVDLSPGVTQHDLVLPAAPADAFLRVYVRRDDGSPISTTRFRFLAVRPNGANSGPLHAVEKEHGEYWIELVGDLLHAVREPADRETFTLTADSPGFGVLSKQVEREATELHFVFRDPATLRVTVVGGDAQGAAESLGVAVARTDVDRRFDFASPKAVDADGTVSFGPLQVGEYDIGVVTMGRSFGMQRITARVVPLVPGPNEVTISVPTLYELTVRFTEEDLGGTLGIERDDGLLSFFSIKDVVVRCPGLAAGTYFLHHRVVGIARRTREMVVRIPEQLDVTFAAARIDAIRVRVDDPRAWLAGRGFRDRDLIVAVDGNEIASEVDVRNVLDGLAERADVVLFTVLRGGQRVELAVVGEEFAARAERGGRLQPASTADG